MNYYAPLTGEVFDEPPQNEMWLVPLSDSLEFGPNSSLISKLQFAWDSTSLGLFRTCPRKYQYTILEGWHQKSNPPPLAFGIFYHKCMEVWFKLLALSPDPLVPRGNTPDPSIAQIQTTAYKNRALASVVKLAGLFGERLPAGDNLRTKDTLIRSVVWYIDQFWDDPAETHILSDGTPAVEHSFQIPLDTIWFRDPTNPDNEDEWDDVTQDRGAERKKIQTYYCGHLDRRVSYAGDNYASDYKTTGYQLNQNFFDAFKPSGQMSGYHIAGAVLLADEGGSEGIMIEGIQLGVNYTRFQRVFISYTPEETEEDLEDIRSWVRRAAACAEEGYWPKNPTSCGRYFKTQEREIINPGCHFREICSKPPHIRHLYLKGNFIKRTWDPLKSR